MDEKSLKAFEYYMLCMDDTVLAGEVLAKYASHTTNEMSDEQLHQLQKAVAEFNVSKQRMLEAGDAYNKAVEEYNRENAPRIVVPV